MTRATAAPFICKTFVWLGLALAGTATVLAEGCGGDAAPARGARPPSVPADYLETPAGYFHPDCVVTTGKGEMLDDTMIVSPSGQMRAVAPCTYPHFDSSGRPT